MKLHANAALSLNQRRRLVRRVSEDGWTVKRAAAAGEVSERTAIKWIARYRADGELGLQDRSSAPRHVANRTPDDRVTAIAALRRLRFSGPEIAELLSMALSTVSATLTRIGMGRLGRLGLEPAGRYERSRPGELIHIDVKRLGRIQVPGKRIRRQGMGRARQNAGRAHGISVEAVMTDNGSCYRSTIHALACRGLGLKHLKTKPYRPQTNGKAARFTRTMLGGWAYAALYRDSGERTAALPGWLGYYNFSRRHGALGHRPPGARLGELNNLVGSYS